MGASRMSSAAAMSACAVTGSRPQRHLMFGIDRSDGQPADAPYRSADLARRLLRHHGGALLERRCGKRARSCSEAVPTLIRPCRDQNRTNCRARTSLLAWVSCAAPNRSFCKRLSRQLLVALPHTWSAPYVSVFGSFSACRQIGAASVWIFAGCADREWERERGHIRLCSSPSPGEGEEWGEKGAVPVKCEQAVWPHMAANSRTSPRPPPQLFKSLKRRALAWLRAYGREAVAPSGLKAGRAERGRRRHRPCLPLRPRGGGGRRRRRRGSLPLLPGGEERAGERWGRFIESFRRRALAPSGPLRIPAHIMADSSSAPTGDAGVQDPFPRERPYMCRAHDPAGPRPHVPRARPCGRARLCLKRAWPLRQARPGPWCGAPGADSASGSRPETRENTGRDRWRQGKEGARDPTGERGTICRAQDPFFRARARPHLPRARPCGRARQSALSSPASSRTAAACPTESHLSHLIPLNPA